MEPSASDGAYSSERVCQAHKPHEFWMSSENEEQQGLDIAQVEVNFRQSATGLPISENSQVTARSVATNSPKWVNLNNIHRTLQRRRTRLPDQTAHWIQSVQADCFFAAAIVVHSIVLGVDVEMTLTKSDHHSFSGADLFSGKLLTVGGVLTLVRSALLVVFTVELVLRARAWARLYLKSFNGLFDAFLVLSAWVDMIIVMSGVVVSGKAERVFHICGLLRLVRIFRLFAIIPALRSIVTGLASTTVASLWVVALLLLVAYVGSLLCTDLLGEQLPQLYGGVLLSVFTHIKLALVEAWPDISDPMIDQSPFWAIYLAMFLLVTNMALLNVVTGIICEKVQSIASGMPPSTKEELQEVARQYQDRLWRLFSLVDCDHSDTLSEAEYIELLKTRDMQKLLQDMDVGLPLDQDHLLTVLDADNNGTLTFTELYTGIRRQQGTRNDHLSQGLQYELSEHDHQIISGIEGTKHAMKVAMRHSAAHAHHRLQRQLAASAAKAEHRLWLAASANKAGTATEACSADLGKVEVKAKTEGEACVETATPPLGTLVKELTEQEDLPKLEELAEHDDLPKLEDACEELVGCLRSLRSTAWRAGKEERNAPSYQDDFDLGCDVAIDSKQARSKSGSCKSGSSNGSSRTSGRRHRGAESSIGDGNSTGHSGDRPPSSSASGSGSGSGGSSRSAPSSEGPASRESSPSNKSGERPDDDDSPTFGSLPAGRAWLHSDIQTLRVHVLGLHGLHTGGVPFSGSFDACVVLRIGSLECRTITAQYSAGAAWHFGGTLTFDLQMLEDFDGPWELEAEVMNTWLCAFDCVGKAVVDLQGLAPEQWHRQARQLDGRQAGGLELAVRLEKVEKDGSNMVADASGSATRPRHGLYAAWSFGIPQESGAEREPDAVSVLPSSHSLELEAKPRVQHKPSVSCILEAGRSSGSSGGSPNSTAFPGLERDTEPGFSARAGHCSNAWSDDAWDAADGGASSSCALPRITVTSPTEAVDVRGSRGDAELLGTNDLVPEALAVPVA